MSSVVVIEASEGSGSLITAACSHRVDNDVAADADPNTGAAVYDTTNGNGGWNEVGGTSESCPLTAGTVALILGVMWLGLGLAHGRC